MNWNPWKEIRRLRVELSMTQDSRNRFYDIGVKVGNDADMLKVELRAATKALNDIADQEKPTSNATVKRMAKIAREALK